MSPWVSQYIGIPYKPLGYTREGCNCWGLVNLIEHEVFHRWTPKHDSFEYNGPEDRIEATAIIKGGLAHALRLSWFELKDQKMMNEGDVILLKLYGLPIHCGVAISSSKMIHIMKGIDSCIERVWTPLWERRMFGVYRCRI